MPRIKIIAPWSHAYASADNRTKQKMRFEHGDMQFTYDIYCRDYDWLLVYDDFSKEKIADMPWEVEELACPREQTILVTQEPPTIKLYPDCYTRQFGYVLTTQDATYLPHPNYRVGRGCLMWFAGYDMEEALAEPNYPKTKLISTVCSNKMMKHTQHFSRFKLTQYLSAHMPELDWYGRGMKALKNKTDALSPYKYHIAVENYIHRHHWTEKIADPLLGMCLTFYAGDPALQEILPEGSFVPIPIDDPPAALEIIQKSIRDNEYEKRLPAIKEARRLIATRYNLRDQVAEIIQNHTPGTPEQSTHPFVLKGRHTLRRNPLNALGELSKIIRFRIIQHAK